MYMRTQRDFYGLLHAHCKQLLSGIQFIHIYIKGAPQEKTMGTGSVRFVMGMPFQKTINVSLKSSLHGQFFKTK